MEDAAKAAVEQQTNSGPEQVQQQAQPQLLEQPQVQQGAQNSAQPDSHVLRKGPVDKQ